MNGFLIHYHEIALKGKNRPFFVEQLVKNIRYSLGNLAGKIEKLPGRIFVSVPAIHSSEEITDKLKKIFGIANFMPAFHAECDIKKLEAKINKEIKNYKFESFRVTASRDYKKFFLTSEQVNVVLGDAIRKQSGSRVDLKNPQLTIFVEILKDRAFFSFEKIKGPGGLPVGTAGKAVSLLSGGIDSPVASFLLMKRGCEVVFVHFHSHPYLNRSSIDKVLELVKILRNYQRSSKVYFIPFGRIQRKIVLTAPANYRIVFYRRLMLRIAEEVAFQEKAGALVTGESLGQVASQTMENIGQINSAVSLPVFRPLIGMDKEEIIELANKIGTYDVSIMPDEDCCQLFTPKNPVTRGKKEMVEKIESQFDVFDIVKEVLAESEVENF